MQELTEFAKTTPVVLGVVVALLLIREVFNLVKPLIQQRTGKNNHRANSPCAVPADVDVREMARKVSDLHEWHSITDEEGVRIWYVRPSFYRALEKLQETQEVIADALQKLAQSNARLFEVTGELCRRVEHVEGIVDGPRERE